MKRHNQRRKKVQARKPNNNTNKNIPQMSMVDYAKYSMEKRGDYFFYLNGTGIGRTKSIYTGFIPKDLVENRYNETKEDWDSVMSDMAIPFNQQGHNILLKGMVDTIVSSCFNLLEKDETNFGAVALLMAVQKIVSKDDTPFTHMMINYKPNGNFHSWGTDEDVLEAVKDLSGYDRTEVRTIVI